MTPAEREVVQALVDAVEADGVIHGTTTDMRVTETIEAVQALLSEESGPRTLPIAADDERMMYLEAFTCPVPGCGSPGSGITLLHHIFAKHFQEYRQPFPLPAPAQGDERAPGARLVAQVELQPDGREARDDGVEREACENFITNKWCDAKPPDEDRPYCTRRPGHSGDHAAAMGTRHILARWSYSAAPPAPRSPESAPPPETCDCGPGVTCCGRNDCRAAQSAPAEGPLAIRIAAIREAEAAVHAMPVEKTSTGDFEDAWDFKYRAVERLHALGSPPSSLQGGETPTVSDETVQRVRRQVRERLRMLVEDVADGDCELNATQERAIALLEDWEEIGFINPPPPSRGEVETGETKEK